MYEVMQPGGYQRQKQPYPPIAADATGKTILQARDTLALKLLGKTLVGLPQLRVIDGQFLPLLF